MPTPTYHRQWIDGDFTVSKPVGIPIFSQPFAGDNHDYTLRQDFQILAELYTSATLGAIHPDYTDYRLTGESDTQNLGNGVVQFTRTYCQTPLTRSDYATIGYSFIGYFGKTANIVTDSTFTVNGRNRFQDAVTCRIQYDFFNVLNGNTILNSAGANIYSGPSGQASASAIPIVSATLYYVPIGTIAAGVFTPTYAKGSANDVTYGTATDFIWDNAVTAVAPNIPFPNSVIPTYPSRSEYQGWIKNGVEIVAESSQIARWMGNIFVRSTKYILPQ